MAKTKKKFRVIVSGIKEILNRGFAELAQNPQIEIAAVVTSRSNEKNFLFFGRKDRNIPVITTDIKKNLELVKELKADFLFSFQYCYRINQETIDALNGHCYNLHFSLLPRYGGCYPISWVLENGETETGVSLHFMTDRFDDGDVIAQKKSAIGPNDTAEILYQKQVETAFQLLKETLPGVLTGKIKRQKQKDLGPFQYYDKNSIDWNKDCYINWRKDISEIHNHIRAFSYPRYQLPRTYLNQLEVTVTQSEIVEIPYQSYLDERAKLLSANLAEGQVIDVVDEKAVVLKDNKLLLIGLIGGMTAEKFLKTNQIEPKARFFTRANGEF